MEFTLSCLINCLLILNLKVSLILFSFELTLLNATSAHAADLVFDTLTWQFQEEREHEL